MSSTTFTFQNGAGIAAGGTLTWDSASNWTPSGIDLTPVYDNTTETDSLVIGDIGVGSYTATFADNWSGDLAGDYLDKAANLTIDHAGATVTQFNGGTLVIATALSVVTGTLDLGDTGEISFEPAGSPPAARSFLLDGVLQGTGTVDDGDPAITGDGTIIASNQGDGSALDIGATIDAGINVQAAAGGTIELTGVQAGVTVTLDDSASGSVQLDTPLQFHGAIAGLAVGHGTNANPGGDIILTNVGYVSGNSEYVTSASLINNVITVDYGTQVIGTIALTGANYTGDHVNWVGDGGLDTLVFLTDSVCYLAGTAILTPDGPVAVETLAPGDRVVAVIDGQRVAAPVKWVGHRTIQMARHANATDLAPIRFKRGSLAEGLPHRDLLVSPPHGLYRDGKLIPARLLVNGMTIVRDTAIAVAAYYHVELDRHALLIAEGVEAESYLDTGNRHFFSNAGLALMLHPAFNLDAGLACWETDACAPLAVSPAAVEPVWRALAERAVAMGHTPDRRQTTDDPDLHLLADGRRIDAVSVSDGVHTFVIRPGVSMLELASRSAVPNDIVPYMDDRRRLGVAIGGIVVHGADGHHTYPADHPLLAAGWHPAEHGDGAVWRWSSGRAVVPVWAAGGPAIVRIALWATTAYPLTDCWRSAA